MVALVVAWVGVFIVDVGSVGPVVDVLIVLLVVLLELLLWLVMWLALVLVLWLVCPNTPTHIKTKKTTSST